MLCQLYLRINPQAPRTTNEIAIPDQLQSAEFAQSLSERSSGFSRRNQLSIVALGSIVLLIVLQQLLHKDYREMAYLESYGGLVANQLARLGQDAMLREDVIALNVLAEQVAAEPAIREIEIYSMDGRSLASYSDDHAALASNTQEFTRPIRLADATAGVVKVVVATQALESGANGYQAQEWLRLLGAALLSLLIVGCLIYWFTRTPSLGTHPNTNTAANTAANTAEVSTGEVGEQRQTSYYLLMVSLFNGNDMPATRREALLASALRNTDAIANLYQGHVEQMSSTAIAVVFEPTHAPERSFEAACAALVLARLGNQPGGARYRYSLQQLHLDENAAPEDAIADSDRVDDALLHAALAEDNTVALTANFARALPRPERLELTSEHSPALRALHTFANEEAPETESNNYFLLSSANPTTQAMLEQQVKSVRAAQVTPD